MPEFSRGFRLLNRIWPPAGPAFPNPRWISDTVQLTHEQLGMSFQNGVRLRATIVNQNAPVGGGDNDLVIEEARQGMVQFPILMTVSHQEAVNTRTVDLLLNVTTSEQDPWGRWLEANQGITIIDVPNAQARELPAFPIMRGCQWVVRFRAMTALIGATVVYVFVEVPGELADFSATTGKSWFARP